jgi:hypothetical protein
VLIRPATVGQLLACALAAAGASAATTGAAVWRGRRRKASVLTAAR